jgi:hypothetical protein
MQGNKEKRRSGYLERDTGKELYKEYDEIISILVSMIAKNHLWTLPAGQKQPERP